MNLHRSVRPMSLLFILLLSVAIPTKTAVASGSGRLPVSYTHLTLPTNREV